jgi:hypothetical protein
VRGSSSPTGFIGPKRSVSSPREAITSTGRQPSKNSSFSKSWTLAHSAPVSAWWKARYSASPIGQFR